MSEAKPTDAAERAGQRIVSASLALRSMGPATRKRRATAFGLIIDDATGLAKKEAALRQISGMSAFWADAGGDVLKQKLRNIDELARAALAEGA